MRVHCHPEKDRLASLHKGRCDLKLLRLASAAVRPSLSFLLLVSLSLPLSAEARRREPGQGERRVAPGGEQRDGGFRRKLPPPAPGPDGLPPCFDRAKNYEPLPVMNEEVLVWKRETPNQTLKRARIRGTLVKVVQTRKSHAHFEVQIGTGEGASVELVYNREFGDIVDALADGAEVDACGDYITSRSRAGNYPPSPMGAILHWIHYNPGDRDGGKHDHGYVAINGVLFGQTEQRFQALSASDDEEWGMGSLVSGF